MRFSVVIPVHNEADNILLLLDEIRAVLALQHDYEIIVVDDGSVDATVQRLMSVRSTYPMLRILRHAKRCGQSAALVSGVTAASEKIIVTIDGDGQNDPVYIPEFLKRYEAQATGWLLLAGQRVKRHDSWLTKVSSRLANGVRRVILADATMDSACGLKLFPRDLFLAMPMFNHMHRFLPALAQHVGANTISIAVQNRPREHGVSKYGVQNRLWVGIVDLLGMVWLQRRRVRAEVTELK